MVAFLLAFGLCLFLSCSSREPALDEVVEDVSYEIINASRVPGVQCRLDVRLSRKVGEEALRSIALKLREEESEEYERMFIAYELPGMMPGAGAWATSHFNPDLKVEILGMTIEESAQTPAVPGGELVGRWLDQGIVGGWYTIMVRDKNLIGEWKFTDGSSIEEKLIESADSGRRRFGKKENPYGEYYVIESDGRLGLYDSEGRFKILQILEAPKPTPEELAARKVREQERVERTVEERAESFPESASEEPAELSENTKRLLALYQELHTFKDAPEFHQVGFGVCCRFNDWQKRVEELRSRTELETLYDIGVLPGELSVLGMEYLSSKGQPTNYSLEFEPKWKAGVAKLEAR